jgi:putative phosphoesterase
LKYSLEHNSRTEIDAGARFIFTFALCFRKVNQTLIGVMSDTHDNLPLIDRAVKRLNETHVELTLHAGDYVAGFVVPRLKELKSKLIGVFGNNDGDHELLKRRFSEYPNMELRNSFAEIHVDGIKIALLHGSNRELLEALINGGNFDFVVYGHNHAPEVSQRGKTLVVNPGEVCGYLTGKPTIGVLDTIKHEARIIKI